MTPDIISGANAVREALFSGHGIRRIYFASDAHVRDRDLLADEARRRGVPFDFVPLAKLNALAGTREHQGVAAKLSPVEFLSVDALIESLADRPRALIVALDGVQHAKNLGMILRTSAAAGADAVLVPKRGGALPDDTVIRASAGAVFRVPIAACNNLAAALGQLRRAEFWIYGLAADGARTVFEIAWPKRIALVLGNESKGLRPVVRKSCDELVSIPVAAGVESLNVSVAAGITLYQIRQHQRS